MGSRRIAAYRQPGLAAPARMGGLAIGSGFAREMSPPDGWESVEPA